MQKVFLIVAVAVALMAGCNKKTSTASGNSSGDAVEQQLRQDAGSGAANCGRLTSQAPEEMKKASDCVMQAAQGKRPFYVAYDMPGMTVGVAGNSEGKLHYVTAQKVEGGQSGTSPEVKSGPCEAALRVAQSGRVTCFAPGSMGSMGAGANPHGGGAMPPGMANPHTGAMGMPPVGTSNPHGSDSGMATSHGGTASKPPQR